MKYKILLFIMNLFKKNKFLIELKMMLQKMSIDEKRSKSIRKIIDEILEHDKIPYFRSIELETYNKCNGDCDFCPINKNIDTREHKFMDENLFYSIIAQLKEMDYRGHVNLFSNNEPLLDDRIFDFARHVKKELPNAVKIIFTNGLLLNLEKFKELIENLDFMVIDHYYEGEIKIRENIAQIAKYCLENPELQSKVKIQLIDKHKIRNNRGSESKNRKLKYSIKSSCVHPFAQFVVRSEGKISLCCCDSKGQVTIGDLNKQTIKEVWYSEKYDNIRKAILKSRKNIPICKYCDNFGPTNIDDYLFLYGIGKNWGEIEYALASDKGE